MEITVKKEEIVSALSTTLGVVEKRQTLPILANVLFEVDENTFKLTAVNLKVFSSTSNKTFARIGRVCLFSTTPRVVERAETISSFLTVISI